MQPRTLRAAQRTLSRRVFLRAALLGWGLLAAGAQAQSADSFLGRPIYSEPATGLQLPPSCEVDPAWRTNVRGTDLEIWIAACGPGARVWLLRRQVVEVVNGRQARLRFEVLDERAYSDETAGDSLSVQCTGPSDETGYVVRGARWREDGKELRLKAARGAMRAEARTQRLIDTELGAIECTRFPEREAMMKRLQQAH
ncbi:MAG TPA: hypothetical protein VED47_01720 [Burkholderiaceae bacterium]|nr:hypothetical protein [Burkholderiaceae bacterium]